MNYLVESLCNSYPVDYEEVINSWEAFTLNKNADPHEYLTKESLKDFESHLKAVL